MTTTPPPDENHPGLKPPARDRRGRYAKTLDTADRDAEACRLRTRGLSWDAIAQQLGFAGAPGAHDAAARALARTVAEPATELRALELRKLDEMERVVLAVLEANHVVVQLGRVVYLGDEPVKDRAPILAAVDRLLRIAERRAKLTGLDAPLKMAVMTIDAVDAEIARLTAELASAGKFGPGLAGPVAAAALPAAAEGGTGPAGGPPLG